MCTNSLTSGRDVFIRLVCPVCTSFAFTPSYFVWPFSCQLHGHPINLGSTKNYVGEWKMVQWAPSLHVIQQPPGLWTACIVRGGGANWASVFIGDVVEVLHMWGLFLQLLQWQVLIGVEVFLLYGDNRMCFNPRGPSFKPLFMFWWGGVLSPRQKLQPLRYK